MTKRYENRGATLAAYIVLHRPDTLPQGLMPHPGHIGSLVAEMQARARSAKRACEIECSYPLTGSAKLALQARIAKHEAGINKALARCGLTNMKVRLGGDPRGPCGYLEIVDRHGDILHDGWGNGLAIY
jgi:hypothetical protein